MTISSAHFDILMYYFTALMMRVARKHISNSIKCFNVHFLETRQQIKYARDKNCVRIALISVDMLWAEGLTGSHLQVLFGHFVF